MRRNIADEFVGFGIEDERSDRDFYRAIFARLAVHLIFAAWRPVLGAQKSPESQVA